MIRLFTKEPETIALGIPAFRIIALSFLSAVLSLIYPVVFQAVQGRCAIIGRRKRGRKHSSF